jgi:hypothetical protein
MEFGTPSNSNIALGGSLTNNSGARKLSQGNPKNFHNPCAVSSVEEIVRHADCSPQMEFSTPCNLQKDNWKVKVRVIISRGSSPYHVCYSL